jgi:hypothetical protein
MIDLANHRASANADNYQEKKFKKKSFDMRRKRTLVMLDRDTEQHKIALGVLSPGGLWPH